MLGLVVQSFVSLTSSLRVISLTVLADSIYNILIFFAEKMWVAFALQKLLTFFRKIFQHICVSLDVNFNESLTNDIVSFEQLGPGETFWNSFYRVWHFMPMVWKEMSYPIYQYIVLRAWNSICSFALLFVALLIGLLSAFCLCRFSSYWRWKTAPVFYRRYSWFFQGGFESN